MHRSIPPPSDPWVAEYTELLCRQACAAADEHAAEARVLGGRLRAAGATPSSVVAGASAALTALTRGRRVRLRDAIAADGVLRPALLAAFDTLACGAAGRAGASDPATRLAELEERAARFDELLAHARDPLFCVRLDTREFVYATPAATAQCGLDPTELQRGGVAAMLACIHPEDRPLVEATYTVGPDGRNPTANVGEIEYRVRVADGTYRWFNSRRVWIRDAAGRPRYMIGQVCEIHAQRTATELLREALAYREGLLQALPDTLLRVRRDGLLLGFKPAPAFVPIGTPQECVGRNLREVLPEALSERILAAVRAAVDEGRLETIEYELPDGDQNRVFEARTARCAPDEALIIVQDLTERRRAEAALRASEAQYRLLVEHQTDMICRTDASGRLLFVSPSYCDTFGVAEADLIGRPFMPLIHEEDRGAVAEGWSRTLVPPYTGEVVERALTRHGWRWQAWHNKAVLDAEGRVTGVVCVGRDIHEQKLAELELERYRQALEQRVAERTRELVEVNARLEAELAERREAQAALRRARDELEARVAARTAELQASEERWRSLVATAPDFIMLLDLDGTIRYLNRASPGIQVEDNLGTHLTLHALPEFAPRIEACLEQVRRTGAFAEFEMAGLRPDGSRAWYACRLGLFRQHDCVVGYTCIATDITARKEAEIELERYRAELEERVRERTAQLVSLNAQLQEELTRRIQTEAELRESEARYRALFEGIPVPVYVVDPATGRMLDANPAVTHVYGWKRSEFLKLSRRDLETPPRRPSPPDGTSAAPLVYHRRRDGTVFPVDVTLSRVQLGGNTVTIEAVRDISARVELEQVLRLQRDLSLELSSVSDLPEALDRLLAAALAIEGVDCGGVYLADPATERLSLACHRNVSAGFAASVALLTPDMREARLVGRRRPLYLPAGHPDLRRAHIEREGLRCTASIPVFADRRLVAALAVASRVADDWSPTARHMLEAIGAHIGIILSSVRARADLRASEQMFRTLAETVPAAIVVLQGERVRFANSMTAQLVGRSLDEVLRTPPWELAPPESRAMIRARIRARHGGQPEPNRYELRIQRPDGTDRWLDCSVARIELDGQPAALGVALDATERKAAAAKERQHLDQLAHVGRVSVVGELATGIAHDLAQPVSAILYYAKGALARLETGGWNPEQTQAVLERIAAQSERAAEIIRRLKDFVRRAEPRRTPQQLAELVAEAVRLAEPLSRAKRTEIDVCAVDGLPLVTVDPIQIEQVLINLLQNSMEAVEGLPPEKRRVTVRIHAPTPTDVRVSVTDRGPGVSPTVRPGLFTAFCTTKPNGLGIGLSMSRSIIEAHDGRLWLEDTPASETTFTFSLPAGPS